MQEKFSQTSVASTITISLLLKRYIVEDKIRAHILSYPTRHSHYSRKDNSHRVYLFPELSVTWLRQAFWKSMILSICNSKRRTESSIFISNKPTKKKAEKTLSLNTSIMICLRWNSTHTLDILEQIHVIDCQ